MSKQANPAVVGAFVLGAIILIVVGLLTFGSLRFNEKTYRCVLYFQGSLHGLDIGAPVTYRGVEVGRIGDIQITFDNELNNYRIPVYIDIEKSNNGAETHFAVAGYPSPDDFFEEMIKQGLRAELKMRSLLTGKLYIELAFSPETEAQFQNPDGKYLEIPTLPSRLEQITQTLESLPLNEMINKTVTALDGINSLINSKELKDGLLTLNRTLNNFDTFIVHLDKELPPLVSQLETTLADVSTLSAEARKALQDTRADLSPISDDLRELLSGLSHAAAGTESTLTAIKELVGKDSPLTYQLTRSMQEVGTAAKSIRQLSDYLQRHPNAILTGKKED